MASDQVETNFLSLSIGGLKKCMQSLNLVPMAFSLTSASKGNGHGNEVGNPRLFSTIVFSYDVLSSLNDPPSQVV